MRYFFIITALLAFIATPANSALVKFEYDAAGNMVSEQGKYYEYNDANQLVRVRKDSPAGEIIAEYVYDYQGQRVKKTENGVTTYYIGKHYEEKKGATVDEKTSYFFANNQRIAKSTQKNKAPPEVSYYLNNHLGSADVIIDENGKLLDNIKYLPYGGYRTFPKEKHTFTGKERDEVTDNYYFEARYYNSSIRHFTQADIITPKLYDPQSLNKYAYVINNPIKYIDPDGRLEYDPSSQEFRIQARDTLSSISKETGITINGLMKFNPAITDADKIYAGNNIYIPEAKNIQAFKWAAGKLGNTSYAYNASKDIDGFSAESNKCNLFVSHAYTKGAVVDFPQRKFFFITRGGPPTAGDLATKKISGTTIVDVDNARIGDLMSWKRDDFSDATGHTSIFTGTIDIVGQTRESGEWGTIGASEDMVRYRGPRYMEQHGYKNPRGRRIGP